MRIKRTYGNIVRNISRKQSIQGATSVRIRYLANLILFPLLAGSLSTQTAEEHRVIRSEIDGIPLVRTEGGPKYDGPLFEIEDDLVLGIDKGEPGWQMFWASPIILISPDGQMVLLEHRRCELYIVSKEGELITRTGRSGSGPGEFRQPYMSMWVYPGESFLINDYALNRATRYSMTGELLGTNNYVQAMGGRIMRFVSLGNDRYLGKRRMGTGPHVAGQPVEGVTQYWFLDSDFKPVGKPIELRYRSSFATTPNSGTGIPFLRTPDLIPFPDGRMLLYDPGNGRLTIFSTFGDPVMHIERDWERPRVSAEDKKEGRKRFLENEQAYMRRIAQKIPFPRRYAAFSRAFTDDRDRIWVEYMDGPSPTSVLSDYFKYDVFGPDGVWLGIQEFDFFPYRIRGDYVYHRGGSEGEGPRFRRSHLHPLIPEAAGKVRQ